jgi:hypothetical protein
MIDEKAKTLIKKFFDITKKLSENRIIRSSKYLGDIGEYLAADIYQIDLDGNQKNRDFDGIDKEGKKCQIKINNSKKSTNKEIGNPEYYDYLVLLVTKDSYLYDNKYSDYFICVYRIESKRLKGKKYLAKELLHSYDPEYFYNFALDLSKNDEKG